MTEARPILLVDDDPDIREALAETLEHQGFRVITARNGQDALNVLRGMVVAPSVILLDLMMPVMDGYGFVAALRAEPALAALPVVIVSASHQVDRGRLSEPSAVVGKPIRVPQLLRMLRDLGSADGAAPR